MMPLAAIPLRIWRTRSHIFTFKGHSIRYWSAGRGEPLLLLHGFPTASHDWHYLWQPLAQQYRVIACDMLGFGDSAKPRRHAYSLLEQADLQQALLAHLRIEEPVHVLAHDYGGNVAQELIARHQQGEARLATCVFLNGGLFAEALRPAKLQRQLSGPAGWWVARAFNRQALVRSVGEFYGPNTGPNESELDDCWDLLACNRGNRVFHRLIAYLQETREHEARWTQAMQNCGLAMRMIVGGSDSIAGVRMLERYRQLIRHADTVLLPDIGHYPHTEAPFQVLRHFREFHQPVARRVMSM
jgi:pimeloyl-ACP methyl ester carboxylesterase